MFKRTGFSVAVFHVSMVCSMLCTGPARAETVYFDGTQPNFTLQLNAQETHEGFETRHVAKTCYQDVQQGYRDECQNVNRNECHTESRQSCTQINRRECTPISRRECTPTTRRECSIVSVPHCTAVPRNVCSNQQVCKDVDDQVCKTDAAGVKTCQPIKRHTCGMENVCKIVSDNVCVSSNENQCRDVADEVCRTVPDTVCRDVPDQVCVMGDQQVCGLVPHQECSQVPNMVSQPYDCGGDQQVSIGPVVDFNIDGNVAVNFGQVPDGISPNEKIDVSIKGQSIAVKAVKTSRKLLLLAEKSEQVSITGSREKRLDGTVNVGLVSVADAFSPIRTGLSDLAVDGDGRILSMALGKVILPEMLNIKVLLTLDGEVVLSKDLSASQVQFSDLGDKSGLAIDLKSIAPELQAGSYRATVTVSLKQSALRGLLNSAALPQKRTTKIRKAIVLN